ncbi:MAG: Gldg family protein [Candidatus Omnitrophica bacterium]|nr:Gldg family protein [Candidatus Omnitrophota bacterium]
MFKQFLIRFQLVIISIVLLLTFGMMMAIVMRYNKRWDLTHERMYSLSDETLQLLNQMRDSKIEIYAFYPANDPNRDELELFLKEAKLHQGDMNYRFYDAERRPQLADYWKVSENYTVIIRFKDRQERVILPDEEMFATTLLKLIQPREFPVCFVSGHGEAQINKKDEHGISSLAESLQEGHYPAREIVMGVDSLDSCQVIAVPGPQQEWGHDEFKLLKHAFEDGKSVLFLIDPMDRNAGKGFYRFAEDVGVALREDVIVDKMSRMVGGDFLVPFINQYHPEHPVTFNFQKPVFLPVARSISLAKDIPENLEVERIAFSGSNSWSETSLELLEQGEASYETETDYPGPLSVAAAIEQKGKDDLQKTGRMVIIGDSDFVTNQYLGVAGNRNFILRAVQWLAKDGRVVYLKEHFPRFQPLPISQEQRRVILSSTMAGGPVFFLIFGALTIVWRRRRK